MNQLIQKFILVILSTTVFRSVSAEDWRVDPIKAVVSAWKERTLRMNDVECSWQETRVHFPGSLIPGVLVEHLGLQATFATPIDPNVGWPDVATTATAPQLIRLHGDWMYHEDFSISPVPVGSESREPFVLEIRRSAFDGEQMQTLSSSSVIKTTKKHDDMKSATWLPLRCFLRPLSVVSVDALTSKEVDLSSGRIRIEDSEEDLEFVVDANRDFGIVSLKRFVKNTNVPFLEFIVDYTESGRNWLPSAWEFTQFRKQGDSDAEYQVSAASVQWITGREFGKGDFQLEIPRRTNVTDLRPAEFISGTNDSDRTLLRWGILLFNVFVAGVVVLFLALRWRKVNNKKGEGNE